MCSSKTSTAVSPHNQQTNEFRINKSIKICQNFCFFEVKKIEALELKGKFSSLSSTGNEDLENKVLSNKACGLRFLNVLKLVSETVVVSAVSQVSLNSTSKEESASSRLATPSMTTGSVFSKLTDDTCSQGAPSSGMYRTQYKRVSIRPPSSDESEDENQSFDKKAEEAKETTSVSSLSITISHLLTIFWCF